MSWQGDGVSTVSTFGHKQDVQHIMCTSSKREYATCVEQQQQGCLEGSQYQLDGFCVKASLDMTGPQSVNPAQFAVLGGELIELLELLHTINHLLWQGKVHMLHSSRHIFSNAI